MLIFLHLSALYQLSPADRSGGVKHQPDHHGPKILVHKAYSRNERNRPVYVSPSPPAPVEWFVSPICCKQLSSQSVHQKSDLAREQRGIWHPSLEHGRFHWWICPKRSKFLVQTCSKKNSTNIYKRKVYQGLSITRKTHSTAFTFQEFQRVQPQDCQLEASCALTLAAKNGCELDCW